MSRADTGEGTAPTILVADRPPDDGREWDAQCARCGSSTVAERCHECGGDGFVLVDDDGFELDGPAACRGCGGRPVWHRCGSGAAWCEGHPLSGREAVERGAIEWFVTSEQP